PHYLAPFRTIVINTNTVGTETIELNEDLLTINNEIEVLPATDTSPQAYKVLLGCFLAEIFTWALPYSYGVFVAHSPNHSSSAVGTTLVGLMMLLSPFSALASSRWPYLRRKFMALGLLLACVSLVAASFVDQSKVGGMIVTQGVLYAIGGVVAYFPCFSFLDEWFVRRKGLACGVAWAGTGLGGSVTPFVLEWLIKQYGARTALRVWAVVELIGVGSAILLVRNRVPTNSNGARTLQLMDVTFLKHPPFWIFEIANVLQALGAYLPMLYLPSFAAHIGLPTFAGPVALALYSISTFAGCVFLGSLVDIFHVSTIILVSTLGQLVAIFAIWGLTNGQALLYLFAIIYGIFGGASFATWPGCSLAIRRAVPDTCYLDITFVLSLLTAGKGLGSVASGPLSSALIRSAWHGEARLAYGSDYGALIVFTGISALFGGLACIGRMLRLV
ncbi:MFS transporter asaE, partial [Pseudocercospora fuligena]